MRLGTRMQPYKETDKWRYYAFDLDAAATPYPSLDPVLSIWRGRRGGRAMPAWGDFDIADFVGWHRHLILYEVRHDPFDLYYRLFGSFPTEAYGANLTGSTLRTGAPEIETQNDIAHFEKLTAEVRIGASSGGQFWSNKEFITTAYLNLPLSRDGRTVSHFLTALIDLDPGERTVGPGPLRA